MFFQIAGNQVDSPAPLLAYTHWLHRRMEIPPASIQAMFDRSPVGIAQIGLDGAWLRVNPKYCQMLGYSEAELYTKTLQDVTHPDDYAEALAGRRKLLDG